MDSNYQDYKYLDSFARIDEILAQPAGNYEEVDSLPDRDRLTFTNGFYANCSALFIDIRDSSKLPESYKRPALAKLYRAFISELVAILNSLTFAREINIVGDCVWGLYNTPKKVDIDSVFSIAAKGNSLIKVLNYKLKKAGYDKQLIRVGIGLSYGRALMVKAGLSGSGISDVVYMGDVVNSAAHLAARGGDIGGYPFMVDGVFRHNLNDDNKALLHLGGDGKTYQGDVVNTRMEEWYDANCK